MKQANGSPGGLKEVKGAYVARLKALYVSRVEKAPLPSWNNKPGEDGSEGKMLLEVRKALAEHEESKVPPTPTRISLDEDAPEETAAADEEEDVGRCEDCGRPLEVEGAAHHADCDFWIDNDGQMWCVCGSLLDWKDEI